MNTRSPKRQRASSRTTPAATAPDVKTAQAVMAPEPNAVSEVADLAYRLFLARGGSHGQDLDDWYEAERQLRVHRS